MDIFIDQKYGTVARLVATYGFIHSERAIEYVLKHNLTKIRWEFRARYTRIG